MFVAGFLLAGCISKQDIDRFVEESRQTNQRELNITITEPVDRDYDKIKSDGVIRMITSYSSITYFIHQGIELGFEYELVHRF
ncbi:MAG: lytic transglycosylase F, partial [Balneolaceae bacterium]|nr:lytic transglycosylase F [Balneolaceae bacterium]